jgi:hypothetical protein
MPLRGTRNDENSLDAGIIALDARSAPMYSGFGATALSIPVRSGRTLGTFASATRPACREGWCARRQPFWLPGFSEQSRL